MARKNMTNAEIDSMSRTTGEKLAAEEKVLVSLPMDEQERNWRCSINGYDYVIPRGVQTAVPLSVAKLISRSMQATVQRVAMENKLSDNLKGI